MPPPLSPHTRCPFALPKLMLWHIPGKKKAKRAGFFLMSPGRIVHFDDDTNDNQQVKGKPVCWIVNTPLHWSGVIMALIKINVSWRVARYFTTSRHKCPCMNCSSLWKISVAMRDILVNTPVSLVITDRLQQQYEDDRHGFRIVTRAIRRFLSHSIVRRFTQRSLTRTHLPVE